MHTTGYLNKLIAPSEDCAAVAKLTAKVGSVAALQYEMLSDAYAMTGDELLLAVTGGAPRCAPRRMGRAAYRAVQQRPAVFTRLAIGQNPWMGRAL